MENLGTFTGGSGENLLRAVPPWGRPVVRTYSEAELCEEFSVKTLSSRPPSIDVIILPRGPCLPLVCPEDCRSLCDIFA